MNPWRKRQSEGVAHCWKFGEKDRKIGVKQLRWESQLERFRSESRFLGAAGTSMVFGYLGGNTLLFTELFPGNTYILAFRGLLLLVLLISALTSLLFSWRVLPCIV